MKMKSLQFACIAVLCVIILSFSGCKKPPTQTCDFDNPLTDLQWLKDLTAGHENSVEARIYQCSYTDGIGFLLEMCVGCPDFGYSFRNCEGEVLCYGGGLSGEDSCPEFEIDTQNKKLIWENSN